MARRKARSESGKDAALGELYLGDFDGFVGRRNELAKELRARGDGEGADRVRALKKPSRVAWAINQLSGDEATVRNQLLGAGAALRDAHERLMNGKAESADLRRAGEEEQAAVTRALAVVTDLSQQAGAGLSAVAADRARQTLHAVSLDEEVRREFEGHRLTTEHDPSGLGAFAPEAPAKGAERRESKRLRDELNAAEAAVRKADEREEGAQREAGEARGAAEDAQRRLKRATKELEGAARDAAAARSRVDALRVGSG